MRPTHVSRRSIGASVALAALFTSCGPSSTTAPADLILRNARVVTVDSGFTIAEAVAIAGGKFVAVGSAHDVETRRGPATRDVDLGGSTVVPGLWDAHNHQFSRVAKDRQNPSHVRNVDLTSVRSIADIQRAIASRAASVAPGSWIQASRGWWDYELAEKRPPNRWELDQAAPHHPVIVPGPSHYVIANSEALRRSGISRRTEDPQDGRIERDPNTGEPTGLLFDRAGLLLMPDAVPPLSEAEVRAELRALIARQQALGLTGIREAGVQADAVEAYRALLDAGELTQRIDIWYRLDPIEQADRAVNRASGLPTLPPSSVARPLALSEIEEQVRRFLPLGTTFGDGMIRISGIKMILDGAEMTGYLRDDYPGQPGYRGKIFIPPAHFSAVCRLLNRLGWPVTAHAVGDAAIDVALDAYEAADAEAPIAGKRWALEHVFLVRPDHIARAKRLGITINSQYMHLSQLGPYIVRSWGEDRANRVLPLRTWFDNGVTVSGGSDGPLSYRADPMLILHGSITRETLWGGRLGVAEALTREQALRTLTINAAYAAFREREVGSIEVGKYADLVVLSDDVLRVPPEEIKSLRAVAVLVGGRVVSGDLERRQSSPR